MLVKEARGDTTVRHLSWSTLSQVMTCYLMVQSHDMHSKITFTGHVTFHWLKCTHPQI